MSANESNSNEIESTQEDFVPRLGAWSVRGIGDELVYSCFLPMSQQFGQLHSIMMNWNVQRVQWTQDHFWVANSGLDVDRLQC